MWNKGKYVFNISGSKVMSDCNNFSYKIESASDTS